MFSFPVISNRRRQKLLKVIGRLIYLGDEYPQEPTQELVDGAMINTSHRLSRFPAILAKMKQELDSGREYPWLDHEIKEHDFLEQMFHCLHDLANKCGFSVMSSPEAYLELEHIETELRGFIEAA